MTAPAIRLKNLSKTYANGTTALAPTSLEIAKGDFVSLVGPSGCGKSTLLRLMAGLISPTDGQAERSAESAEIGFVFQDATLMPWATLEKNVSLPLDLKNLPKHDVLQTLARVGLEGFSDSYPRELSGGMQMRASLARAIVTNPQVLLMDEPFAALDEFTRFRLNDDLLRLWQQNGWTVVFVTHSIREAVFLSQRIIVMSPRPGRVIADLPVQFSAPRDPSLRHGHAFADRCAEVSAIMENAMRAAGLSA